MPDFAGGRLLRLALVAVAFAPGLTLAASQLDGLEMDVMVGGERPAQAIHRITLPLGVDALDAPEGRELDDQETLLEQTRQNAASDEYQRAEVPESGPIDAE